MHKDSTRKRTRRFVFRFSEDEATKLEQNAAEAGAAEGRPITLSTYVRRMAIELPFEQRQAAA